MHGRKEMDTLALFLVVLRSCSAVVVILVNSYLWTRFPRLYECRSPERMPFLLFDYRGRWARVLRTPQADPVAERVRRQLHVSQLAFLIPIVILLAGVALASSPTR